MFWTQRFLVEFSFKLKIQTWHAPRWSWSSFELPIVSKAEGFIPILICKTNHILTILFETWWKLTLLKTKSELPAIASNIKIEPSKIITTTHASSTLPHASPNYRKTSQVTKPYNSKAYAILIQVSKCTPESFQCPCEISNHTTETSACVPKAGYSVKISLYCTESRDAVCWS